MKPLSSKWMISSIVLASMIVATGCGTSASTSTKDTSNATGASTPSSTSSSAPSAKSLFPHGITLVVGYGPGGGNDQAARTLQPYLQQTLGVPVAVQNMPGGGGTRAAAYVYQQKPDSGKFLVWFAQTAVLEQYLEGGAFDSEKFTPVYGMYGNSENVLISAAGSKFKTLEDLENAQKPVTVGVSGVANAAWLGVAYLSIVNHVKLQVVPFSSGSEATNAALGGSVDVTMTSMPSAVTSIKDGRAQGILQMGSSTNPQLANVPDIVSAGGTSDEAFDNNIGIFGPPGMSSSAVSILDQALNSAEKNSDFVKKAQAQGIFPVSQDSQAFSNVVTSFTSGISSRITELKKFKSQGGKSQ